MGLVGIGMNTSDYIRMALTNMDQAEAAEGDALRGYHEYRALVHALIAIAKAIESTAPMQRSS